MPIDPAILTPQLVGELSPKVIKSLCLPCPPGPIYIGRSNIIHIRESHPDIFRAHLQDIPDIIACPDYIAIHPYWHSIEYIKQMDILLMVAVRGNPAGKLFVKSLFKASMQDYLDQGTLIPYL